MDPQLLALLMHQQQGGQLPSYGQGMFGGQQGQMPGQPDPNAPQHHGGGMSPLMALSPLGGMLASGGGLGKAGLFGLSPALGLANLFGAFK